MADSSEPAFLFLYRKEAVAPVDYLSTFATAPLLMRPIAFNKSPGTRPGLYHYFRIVFLKTPLKNISLAGVFPVCLLAGHIHSVPVHPISVRRALVRPHGAGGGIQIIIGSI